MRTQDVDGTGPQLRRRTPLSVSTSTDEATATRPKLTTPKKKWIQLWSLQQRQEQTQEQKPESVFAGTDLASAEEGEVIVSTTPHDELCVTMPPPTEASTLSPSADRSSPTPTASISPSANKVKENESSRTPSPTTSKILVEQVDANTRPPPPTRATSSSSSLTSSESLHDEDDDDTTLEQKPAVAEQPDADNATSKRKAELFHDDRPDLTASERLRLERRKKKKSNWDVGDPRAHGGTLDLAALNLLSSTNAPATHPASFAKFPRARPAFRHSQSLDANINAPRRPFSHSTSLPLERRPRQTPGRFHR